MKNANPGKSAGDPKWIGVGAIQSPEPAVLEAFSELEAFSDGFWGRVSLACPTGRDGAAACRGIAIGM
jgi:hypothetical protein